MNLTIEHASRTLAAVNPRSLNAYLEECEASPDMQHPEFAAAVKEARDALDTHEANMKQLGDALAAGDGEAAAKIVQKFK